MANLGVNHPKTPVQWLSRTLVQRGMDMVTSATPPLEPLCDVFTRGQSSTVV